MVDVVAELEVAHEAAADFEHTLSLLVVLIKVTSGLPA
jgi:hypothetical protein